MRRVLLSFALIGPVGCFALKLDEFPAPRCASQMDCDYLNRAERIEAAACMRYQCAMQERVCVLAPRDDDGDGDPSPACGGRDCDDANALRVGNPANPRSREVCDGIDNNCNEIIDEGALLRGPARAVVSGGAAATTLVSAERISGGMEVLVGAQSALGVASSGMVLPLQYRSQLRQADRLDQQDNACPVIDSSGNFAAGRCSFQEAALAPMDPSRWFLLTVSASSCMQGQLRAGWFDATRAVVLAQPASNIAVGIDVSQSVSCTGARRTPFVAGATGVSLASIVAEGAPSRALGAWLARARNVAGCGMSSNVEAMGLWLASTRLQDSTLVSGVRGTNDGSPVVLGTTAGSGAPAVSALGDVFSVAYGSVGGGLRVQVIPAFAVPDGSLDVSRMAFALTGPSTTAVDAVVTAPGPSTAGVVELGVAWKDGCAAEGALWFSRVSLDRTNPQGSRASEPVRLSTAGSHPALVYSPQPMVVPGARRGAVQVTAANAGGWLVAWSEGARVLARRVAAADGVPVDAEATALGDNAMGGVGVRLGRMGADATDDVTYVMPGVSDGLFGGSAVCRPRR
jgi:hypothetical protein